jgi:uncharacterized protein (TIRG00374 family)
MKLTRLLAYAVAAAVLVAVLLTVDFAEVWRALKRTDPALLAAILLLNPLVLALFVLRTALVLSKLGRAVAVRVLAPVTVLGNVAGALTPAGSGEYLRATAFERNAGLPFQEGVGVVLFERTLSTYLLILSTLAMAAIGNLNTAPAAVVVTLCLLGVFLPWLIALVVLGRIASPEGSRPVSRVLAYAVTLARQVRFLLVDLRLVLTWSAITLVTFALLAAQFALVARSIDVHLSMVDAWVAFGGSGLTIILSLLPFGVGIGDGSLAAILHSTGVPLDESAAIALLVRGAITLPQVGFAVLAYGYLERIAALPEASSPQ